MDVQATVNLNRAFQVDQAIFTSIRTAMGEGYRIVASSPGIKREEKQELTRRLPSHDSLCESSPSATALLSFPMASGRHCVALSQYAGQEHTARGGGRVFTHVLLLSQPHFAAFSRDPFAIQSAACRANAIQANLKPPCALEPLELVAGTTLDASNNNVPGAELLLKNESEPALSETDCARLKYLLDATMGGEQLVVTRASAARSTLRRIVQAMPIAMRAGLAASAGSHYSPHRKLQLVLLSEGAVPRPRRTDGDHISYDWHDVPPPIDSRFSTWVSFVGRHWESGHYNAVGELATLLTQERTPEQLERVVSLYEDMVSASEANSAHADEPLNTNNAIQQHCGVRTALFDQLGALLLT